MALYLARLRPDGLIAAQISNHYLDLRGVLVGLSQRFQMDFVIVDHVPMAGEFWATPSRWCLLTRDKALLQRWLPGSVEARRALEASFNPVLWTDDHASLLRLLRSPAATLNRGARVAGAAPLLDRRPPSPEGSRR